MTEETLAGAGGVSIFMRSWQPEGAPHGITDTHKDRLNADLLAFVRGVTTAVKRAGAAS